MSTQANDLKSQRHSLLSGKMSLVLKFAFIGALLYFLVKKGALSLAATQQALSQHDKVIPAMTALFLTTFLSVFRWQWLLKAQNIHLAWSRILQLTLIGNFFNIALPGAVSGDFVKAFYIGKEIKGHRARAFGSILFDRVAGLSALVLVSAGAILPQFRTFMNSPLLRALHLTMGIAAASVLFFYGYLFLVREHHDPVLRLLKQLEKKVPKAESITRIYLSLRHYHHYRIEVTKVVLVSVLIHLTVGWSCLCFAQALGESQLALGSLYIVVPLGLLVTAIPIAPGGVGTGNLAFLYFFHLIGSERGADVYSLLALTNILFGSIGGLVYMRFKGKQSLDEIQSVPVEI